jgi:formate-nitrite transporter family protein
MADLSVPVGPTDHVKGAAGGDLELVMYGDFECPYCAASQRVLARVEGRLEGRLRFVFRHFPMEAVHPNALRAAEVAEAAAAQDAFWEMHDALYAAGGRLGPADLLGHAARLGLDVARVEADLDAGTHRARVERDRASGAASGVSGTPSFFANGRVVEGAFDARSLVDALLA